VPDELVELESQVAKLEHRLARAKIALEGLRKKSRRTPAARILVMALTAAACSMLIAAAMPPTPDKSPNVYSAPFQVVNSVGKKIFEVSDTASDHPRGFALFDTAEKPLALGVAGEGVSEFRTSSADGTDYAAMGFGDKDGQFVGMTLKYNGQPRLFMFVKNGKPEFYMMNDNNKPIVAAGQGESGGGLLLLNDLQGNPVVKFSTSAAGAGTVVTYPNSGAGGAIVGLKGTMLCGRGGCGK